MTEKHPWETFFDGHAPVYMDNVFTRDTVREVGFLLETLDLAPASCILDVGCGTGRHAIELARRGYQVTGVDISSGMLIEAAKSSVEAGVIVQWVHANATQFTAAGLYDAAICLCEGAFALLGIDDDPVGHDLAILRNVHAAVKPGACFVLTTLNGFAKIRQFTKEDVESGRFDPLTLVETYNMEYDTPGGKQSVVVRERGYLPQELVGLFQQTGFEIEHIWGGTAGNWGRRKLELDEIEVMVVARKANSK